MAADSVRAETRYTRSEAGYVAYQLFGHGPQATMLVPSWLQNLDMMWEEPSLARYLGRLGSFSRVICFDKRGSGVRTPSSSRRSPRSRSGWTTPGSLRTRQGSTR